MVKRLTAREVAKEMGVSPMMVKFLIQSGMPIGQVCRNPKSKKDRIIIFEDRWKAYKAAQDLKGDQ